MSELPNRSDLEAQFARKFGRVARRHLHEFRELLGNPPDIANVPPEFWDKMQKETDREVYPLLLLLFSESAEYHGWAGPDMGLAAFGYAVQQSGTFADQWATSTRTRLDKGFQKLHGNAETRLRNSTIVENLTPIGVKPTTGGDGNSFPNGNVSGETIDQHREQNRTIDRTNPGQYDRKPETIDRDELDDLLEQTFGPHRIETNAIDETTRAQHAGGEAGIEATVGISTDDVWRTERDERVCPICKPMDGQLRRNWPWRFSDGPPCHPRCRCSIDYALFTPAEAAGRIVNDD